jgi:hypothetical protein
MITPKIWGPHFWEFFHLISLKYPNNPSDLDKLMAYELINSIYYILPCKMCRIHFKNNIKKFPLNDDDIMSRDKFIKWFINFHNVVNISLKKSSSNHDVSVLNHLDYFFCFQRVMNYIGNDIDNDVKFSKCQGVKKFIKSALHFGGKNYENYKFDFYNHKTFLDIKKKIFDK